MPLTEILSPSRTHCGAAGSSKKRILENVAEHIGKDIQGIDAAELFKNLVARERLGSTGIGHGVAIPHCRLPTLDNIIGTLVRLDSPVDFEAIDDQPVDLLFVLLVPELACDEHLQILAQLAELFSRADFRDALRSARDDQVLYETAVHFDLSLAAVPSASGALRTNTSQ